ncbi:hypothetical protein Hesp01_30910 [Herbidospora sp. NBRC 101105]|nr:hypothetical protein Hesp01_30910 [Herbidospora sp. NBRC 101105]
MRISGLSFSVVAAGGSPPSDDRRVDHDRKSCPDAEHLEEDDARMPGRVFQATKPLVAAAGPAEIAELKRVLKGCLTSLSA